MANNSRSSSVLDAEDQVKALGNAIDGLRKQSNELAQSIQQGTTPESAVSEKRQQLQEQIASLEAQRALAQTTAEIARTEEGTTKPSEEDHKPDEKHKKEDHGTHVAHGVEHAEETPPTPGDSPPTSTPTNAATSQASSTNPPESRSRIRRAAGNVGKGVGMVTLGPAGYVGVQKMKNRDNENTPPTSGRTIGRASSIQFNDSSAAGSFQVGENRQHSREVGQSSQAVSEIESQAQQRAKSPTVRSSPSQKNQEIQQRSGLRRAAGIAGKVALGTTVGVGNVGIASVVKKTGEKNNAGTTTRTVGRDTKITFNETGAPETFEVNENGNQQIQRLTQDSIKQTVGSSPSQKNKEANDQQSKKRRVAGIAGKVAKVGTMGVGNAAILSRMKNGENENEKAQNPSQNNVPSSPTQAGKIGAKALKIGSLVSGGGLLYHFLPGGVKSRINKFFFPKKQEATTAQSTQPKKNAKDYQKGWINRTLQKAKTDGYNRFSLLQKMMDWKVWQSRGWQTGKHVLATPFTGAGLGIRNMRQRPNTNQHPSSNKNQEHSHGIHAGDLNNFTPRNMGGRIWNRFGGSRLSGMNTRLGQRFGPRAGARRIGNAGKNVAGKAGKKVASSAGKKILQRAAMEPHVLALIIGGIVVVVAILAAVYLMMIIISALMGGGISGGGSGGGGNNGGGDNTNPAPPTEPPIPGFTLTKSVSPTAMEEPGPITYTLSYTYGASNPAIKIENITIYDPLPAGVEFVPTETTGKFNYNESANTVSWPLSETENQKTLTLTVRAKSTGIFKNQAYAETTAPTDTIIDPSTSLRAIAQKAAGDLNVPVALILAVTEQEGGALSYTEEDVAKFNTTDWFKGLVADAPSKSDNDPLILKGYGYNTCDYPRGLCAPGSDVRGAAQIELGTWGSLVPKISSFLPSGRTADRRYVYDAIYGNAGFIRNMALSYSSIFGPESSWQNWSDEQIKKMAISYCAGNPNGDISGAACGHGTYANGVLQYYKGFLQEGL